MKAKMIQSKYFVITFLVLVGLWIPQLALAGWPGDPTVNVPICTAEERQYYPQITSDGCGGAIITWVDRRGVPGRLHLYAQRVDSDGNTLWIEDGVPICWTDNNNINNFCAVLGSNNPVAIVSDGDGGAIITWAGSRQTVGEGYFHGIYAQRVDAGGNLLWWPNYYGGVPICGEFTQTENVPTDPAIVSDGYGGAIITWRDSRSGNADIYAQRVNASGQCLWTPNGVPICTDGNPQFNPVIASDGYGGAIIAWEDMRGNRNIYAQRVDASGNTMWTDNGISMCEPPPGGQYNPAIVSDGRGGAIITWDDVNNIYAQCVDADGTRMWTENGKPTCTEGGS